MNLILVWWFQGSPEPPDSGPLQHPGGGSGEVLGLRPVLRRDQRHPSPDRRLRVQPAAGHASPPLHPRVQHVRSFFKPELKSETEYFC